LVDIIKNVVLKKVRYTSENGCVFTGQVLSEKNDILDESLVVLVSGKIQKQVYLAEGKCFLISGNKHSDYINKWTGEIEPQVKATKIVEHRPSGRNFIHYITHSHMFPKIEEKTAKKLYSHFDNEIYKILDDKDIEQLKTINGISEDTLCSLIAGWHEDNNSKVIEWLDVYSLPISIGSKLIKAYRQKTIQKVESDPYRLIAFTTWKKVDSLARNNFKIAPDDPRRLHAAVTEVLFNHYINEGNTAVDSQKLIPSLAKIIDEQHAREALANVYKDGGFRRIGEELFQSRGAYLQEKYLAKEFVRRIISQTKRPFAGLEQSINRWESLNYKLTEEQSQAVVLSLTSNLSVITGNTGVGKTYVLEAINYVISDTGGKAIQISSVGRVAKRLKEKTGHDAVVIENFLHSFDDKKLKGISHIIIDECSMVDLYSFVRIFRKLEKTHKVVLVGDSAQLSPIGAGRIFHYLCDSKFIPFTQLTKIWKQSENTGIPMVSQLVQSGEWENLEKYNGNNKGVSFLHADKKTIYSVTEQVFGELGGITPDDDVKIICPTNSDTDWGTLGINRNISSKYLSSNAQVFFGISKGKPKATGFRIGDTVMVTKNIWSKEVVNGSLGVIVDIASLDDVELAKVNDQSMPVMYVKFDHGTLLFDSDDLSSLQWGYGITCHEAQGSLFKKVIIPVISKRNIDRTWIYSALTRSTDQVVLIGNLEIIKNTVKSLPSTYERTTGLSIHVASAFRSSE